ncbi:MULTISPECIES: alpha-amylase family protein [Halocynthiibacter]|uniref:Beta-galactosidase trimerization domain-containing protein n=1 Tax=Halocynthiibacter halioticoli TaxID=2986804 RepID=A0AAE3IWH1_9RHOB|nr:MULTISPECIES: alpha-amylase family protein [Halocynthiibacter]MCV6823492.1 beta-galactosidase trimerization domain-containing protein [Halocynthiibacter halioticoli]MCW4056493.1 beta-galactosidase trimerization domain-containing protein [Halocynthiibacter sp. SDUM655004]
MRFRQIHLDFHTAPQITDIGSQFDPADFAKAFSDAKVDSVNVFSKCHHGYSYHPTKVGEMHPHLDSDLMGAQIEALQGVGIKTPVYLSAIWDELAAQRHPEWRVVAPDFSRPLQFPGDNKHEGVWKYLDLSSPYTDYLCAQIDEAVTHYPQMDGLWIDICFQKPSVSVWAQQGMEAEGLDWTDAEHRDQFAELTSMRFFERVKAIADKGDVPLFFNLGHIRRGRSEVLRKYFSHIEIESLPTGQWGYEHFPVSARYVEPLGMPFLGMTGKFHHMWGEMGGYKKPEALVYECGAMLAQGARICIGDHLNPSGSVDHSTYKIIGEAYDHVEACEPWAIGSTNKAEIGVISHEAVGHPLFSDVPSHHSNVDDGTVRALLENRFTFDLLDDDADFSPYRLIILPDAIPVSEDLKTRLDAFIANGGRLLLTGASGISDDGMLYPAGATHHGVSKFTGGDYALPIESLRAEFVNDPMFMYQAPQLLAADDAKSLGMLFNPYFNREKQYFSGHLHTPARPEPSGFVFGASDGAVTRLAHPVFSIYHQTGAVALLQIIGNVVRQALGQPQMIQTSLPTAGRATLRAQEGRDILHMLFATPVQRGNLRGDAIQPIQDIIPLHDIEVDVEADDISAVKIVPEGRELPFEAKDGRVKFTVPVLKGHAMIELTRA